MKIFRATSENANAVSSLFNCYRIFYKQPPDLARAKSFITERLKQKDSIIFLAVNEKSQEIGFAQLYPSLTSIRTDKIFILNDIFVVPEFRGKGVGRELIRMAKEFAIAEGGVKLSLMTENNNIAGQKLYESEGYIKDERFMHYNLILS